MSTHGPGYEPIPTKPAIRFEEAAKLALANTQLRRNMGKATQTIRGKRKLVVHEMPDWEALREAGRAIKERTIRHLSEYLIQLEVSVTKAGGHVHWARDAAEANRIIVEIAQKHGAKSVVKVKSLTTDEIGLNDDLIANGIEPTETDLAELIIQLAGDVVAYPGSRDPQESVRDPRRSSEERSHVAGPQRRARSTCRSSTDAPPKEVPLRADGCLRERTSPIAETGSVCVVESEGNGRMCLTLPKVLVSVMGLEKVIPTWQDLEVFLQLLPRSSTGRADEPVYIILDRRDTRRWPTGIPPDPARQWSHQGSCRPRRPLGALLHPLQRMSEYLPGLRANGRARL